MRTAIDLGIHNEHHASMHVRIPGVLERDMNRRLFWTSYCVDRNLSAALGRPPAIHDDWISAQVPFLAVESSAKGAEMDMLPDAKRSRR